MRPVVLEQSVSQPSSKPQLLPFILTLDMTSPGYDFAAAHKLEPPPLSVGSPIPTFPLVHLPYLVPSLSNLTHTSKGLAQGAGVVTPLRVISQVSLPPPQVGTLMWEGQGCNWKEASVGPRGKGEEGGGHLRNWVPAASKGHLM